MRDDAAREAMSRPVAGREATPDSFAAIFHALDAASAPLIGPSRPNPLVVPPASRGLGQGSGLMLAAEAEARRLGCGAAWLDTLGSAAEGFYTRLGYRVFGALAEFPAGHARLFLHKRLEPGTAIRDMAPV